MHLLLCADDSEIQLVDELAAELPLVTYQALGNLLFDTEFPLTSGRAPYLAFVRQLLPDAQREHADSIGSWARLIGERITGLLPDAQPWMLHVAAQYGARLSHRTGARAWHSATRRLRDSRGAAQPRVKSSTTDSARPLDPRAGQHRANLIREGVLEWLQKRRRHLLRNLRPELGSFTEHDSLVQLLLLAPDDGYISICHAPIPFEQRHLISPFPKGEIEIASDKAAPSRAFAKLVEAERRLGRSIQVGETCVDLGASPGSWSYVGIHRGARVYAVDRSPLREELMRHRLVQFCSQDAFEFKPQHGPVDWLLCDVIAPVGASTDMLIKWLRHKWCRHFVVTIKLKDTDGPAALKPLKEQIPRLTKDFFLTRLCANKKEVTAFGSLL